MADVNEYRDYRLCDDLAKGLKRKARVPYAEEDLGSKLESTIYALDSTTIDHSLSLFSWDDLRSATAEIKMHTQLELRGPIPACIHITGARNVDWD